MLERNWKYYPLMLLFTWFTVDGCYCLYWGLVNPKTLELMRAYNFLVSLSLYGACGLIWLHRGTLEELLNILINKSKNSNLWFKHDMLPVLLSSLISLLYSHPAFSQDGWSGWRGDGSGISKDSNLPVSWDGVSNLNWKTELDGEGNSSPVVIDKKIFITASADAGKLRRVLCIDAAKGQILWQKEFKVDKAGKTYPKNGYASSTPCSDGKHLFVFFDEPGLLAFDLNGNQLWNLPLGPFKNNWNMASSPAVCDGKVIMVCDQNSGSFIVAAESATGKEIWRTPRKQKIAYASPLVIDHKGKKQIVVNGSTVVSYDADDGKELWQCRGMLETVVPTALYSNGLVYFTCGRNGPSIAVDPDGRGDITESHVRMHAATGGPYVPSPLIYPFLFLPSDNGSFQFIDKDGKIILKDRVDGHFTSSPVAGDNKIYWPSEKGDVYVIDVSGISQDKPSIRILAKNSMGEDCLASPAIFDGKLLIRTARSLYCINAGDAKVAEIARPELSGTLPELVKMYDAHQAAEGEDIRIRLDILSAVGRINSPETLPFLEKAVLKDNHWDVCEEALKILGSKGEMAESTLLDILEKKDDKRPFVKILASGYLGKLKTVKAVPTLLDLSKSKEAPVRAASLEALADIGRTSDETATQIIPALKTSLSDPEGTVKIMSLECVSKMKDKLGGQRDEIITSVKTLLDDRNELVRQTAKRVLAEVSE